LQSSHARVTWMRFSFFAILLSLVLRGPCVVPGSGGGSRTRDTTIMSRVL
jgi:hypothetical protein